MPFTPRAQVQSVIQTTTNAQFALQNSTNAGATSVTVNSTHTDLLAGGSYVAVAATTTKCEVRRVTAVSGGALTLDAALVYAHSAGDAVFVLEGTLVPLDWFGCKANEPGFDSSLGLQQAFNDVALRAGFGYGLTGHMARYYNSTPLCVYDNTHLDRMMIVALAPISIDLSQGLDRMGVAGQYHVTMGGQFGSVSSVDTGANTITFSTVVGGVNDSVIFYPVQGATLPGGLEAGRRYFTTTNPSGDTFTISKDYGGTTLDITSSGSGTTYFYSTGMCRILWDFVTLDGANITNLNGLLAALQQPTTGRNVRLDEYRGPQGASTFYGQQADFYNLVIVNSSIGLNCQGMQFLHIFGGNLELCDIGMRTIGVDPGGDAVYCRDIQLFGIHFEANTTKSISLGDLTVGMGIYGGVNSGTTPFLVVDSTQVLGYSIQNMSSISTGTAVDDAPRGLLIKWDDLVQDGVAGQIANFVAPATHGLNPSKSWWLLGNGATANHIVWDAYNNDFRLNGTGTKLRFGDTGPLVMSGAGDPESNITAPVGSLYLRTDGGAGTSLYVKQTGTGTTGWGAK